MGDAKPYGIMFDVMHMNVNKTFSTSHSSLAGRGPFAVNKCLSPCLSGPIIIKEGGVHYIKVKVAIPEIIGAIYAFRCDVGVNFSL